MFFLGLMIGLAPQASSGEPRKSIEFLTGNSEKTWTQTGFETVLGSDKACTAGEEYIFRQAGTLMHRFCKEDTVVAEDYEWEFRNDGIDDFVTFNGIEYRLITSTKRDKDLNMTIEEVILRREGERIDLTTDILLQHIP